MSGKEEEGRRQEHDDGVNKSTAWHSGKRKSYRATVAVEGWANFLPPSGTKWVPNFERGTYKYV